MVKNQQCPWCFSEKFKIDFDSVISRGKRSNTRGSVGVSTNPDTQDDTKSEGSASSGDHFDKIRKDRLEKKRQMRNESIHKFRSTV